MTRRGFSARAWGVALVCSVLMVLATAGTAGATATSSHVAAVRGKVGPIHDDPKCPPNVEFPGPAVQSQRIVSVVKTRVGPAILDVNVCYIFEGAMGGETLRGTFALYSLAGVLRGTANGVVGFGAADHFQLTLTVARGSLFLSHVGGTMALDGTVARDSTAFVGTLTSNLHLSWGGWRQTTPFAFS